MGARIQGTYEGEGPNVSGVYKTPANTPDVPLQGNVNEFPTGQGTTTSIATDIRRRLRTSSEPARGALVINYSSTDQVFPKATRALYLTTTGTLVVRFADDANDVILTGLIVGQVYSFSLAAIRNSGSSGAVGLVLF